MTERREEEKSALADLPTRLTRKCEQTHFCLSKKNWCYNGELKEQKKSAYKRLEDDVGDEQTDQVMS